MGDDNIGHDRILVITKSGRLLPCDEHHCSCTHTHTCATDNRVAPVHMSIQMSDTVAETYVRTGVKLHRAASSSYNIFVMTTSLWHISCNTLVVTH